MSTAEAHPASAGEQCVLLQVENLAKHYRSRRALEGVSLTVRAGEIYKKTLAEYEPPPLDDAIREELADYVTRRRAELGD